MKLKGSLNFWDVFCVGAGSMISSGIFVLPSIAYASAGSSLLVSYFLAGLLVLPALFTKMELASALPRAGGSYFFMDRILGAPFGMVAGLANWFSIAFKSAFALLGLNTFLPLLFPNISITVLKLISVLICVLFMLINLFSTKSSGSAQIVLVVVLLLILLEFVSIGQASINYNNFRNIRFDNLSLLLGTAGMVFISYGGITKIASLAEDIQNKKTMVKATVSAFFVVQTLYLLIVGVLIGVLPEHVFKESPAPLSEASLYLTSNSTLNNINLMLTAIAAVLAFVTTANAGIMSASRVPLAMSRDKMLPQFFSKQTKKGVPYIGIFCTTLFMISVVLFFDLPNLAKLASLFMLLLFIGNELSLIIIRYAKIYNYKPIYKSPMFPWMQIVGIVFHIVVIISMGGRVVLEALAYITAAVLVYFFYARKYVHRKSAFMKLITDVTKREIKAKEDINLNDELLSILLTREGIKEDKFDQLIKHVQILDLEEAITQEDFFELVSTSIHDTDLPQLSKNAIRDKFVEREKIASTLIPVENEYFLLPHIVVEGTEIFGLKIIRCMQGIHWEGKNPHTAFVLFCSQDQRNMHLKTIMNIAQSFQDAECYKNWKKSSSVEELRSTLLLAKRNRQHEMEEIIGV